MLTQNGSRASAAALPKALRSAQAAIDLPEVQEMLRRLSAYQLGIFMPHMHDEGTGQFQPLPDELAQVEPGLKVSFHPTAEVAKEPDRFLPVAWLWRAGAATTAAACEMVSVETPGETEHDTKHKMPPPS